MKYLCDSCGHTDTGDNLLEAKKLFSRLAPGGMFTDKQCPECEALCFPVDPTGATRATLGESVKGLEHAIQFLGSDHKTTEPEGQDIKSNLENIRAACVLGCFTPRIYELYWTKEMLDRNYGEVIPQNVICKFEKRADKSTGHIHEIISDVFFEIIVELVEEENNENTDR